MFEKIKISDFIFDCAACPMRCDGVSKGNYQFTNDVMLSEHYENQLISIISNKGKVVAAKCNEKGYPDIEIRSLAGQLIRYVEVKVQQRVFMNIQRMLPDSGLYPSETVALNLSDLIRYFQIEHDTKIPVTIVWVLMKRPCIVSNNEVQLFYQDLSELEKIYLRERNKRRFTRQSGEGDVVEGVHKGVTVNYHFSLNELKRWQ